MTGTTGTDTKPTIVLVHGAFADASSWNGVIERLLPKGYTVVAPAGGLRGVTADSAYLASFVGQIAGPVLLVGHSYGGAVITNAATDASNVVGLVYVAAFAPDLDERLGEVTPESKDSVLMTSLDQLQYPTGRDGETAVEFVIKPDRVKDAFAGDLPLEQIQLIGATQRPIAEAAFSDASGTPAWKNLPSWAVVATGDKAAGADLVESMARRAGAEIVKIEASHVVMISHPQEVADVIMKAASAVMKT
jgi:pimeloyl-ACP methyl ester carboxylesterase